MSECEREPSRIMTATIGLEAVHGRVAGMGGGHSPIVVILGEDRRIFRVACLGVHTIGVRLVRHGKSSGAILHVVIKLCAVAESMLDGGEVEAGHDASLSGGRVAVSRCGSPRWRGER